jgi:ATP-dependent Lon protease
LENDLSINEESGDKNMIPSIEDLRHLVTPAGIPRNVKQIAYTELEQLSDLDPGTYEYRSRAVYTGFVLGLPWNKKTEDEQDVLKIDSVLQEDLNCSQGIRDALVKHISDETKKPRILVVDDEKIALESMVYTVNKAGYNVVPANNGALAIEKLAESSYDVVITDLIMGDVDGAAVLNEVKNKYPDIKAIMVTGYATVDTAVDAMRMGAFHYIEKPLSLDDLRLVVKDALKGKFSATRRALCLAGNTREVRLSIITTIAKSLGRKMLSLPLAEVNRISDINGQNRAGSNAGPGRFLKEINGAGVMNPVFMLEELDKAGQELEPGLLEALDNSMNSAFIDNYLEVPFDMSNVIFIATVDDSDKIKGPLRDVLDIIEV